MCFREEEEEKNILSPSMPKMGNIFRGFELHQSWMFFLCNHTCSALESKSILQLKASSSNVFTCLTCVAVGAEVKHISWCFVRTRFYLTGFRTAIHLNCTGAAVVDKQEPTPQEDFCSMGGKTLSHTSTFMMALPMGDMVALISSLLPWKVRPLPLASSRTKPCCSLL